MTETITPEVNVAALMERVRAKAEEIRRIQARSKLPAIHEVGVIVQANLPKPARPRTDEWRSGGDRGTDR